MIRRSLALAVGGLGVTLAAAGPAAAVALITVNVDSVAYGNEGDLILVGSAVIPSDVVGETCLIKGESVNQESVHPNNDLIIVVGDQTLVVEDVEGLADQVTEVDEFEQIGSTLEVYLRFGPDGVTSGGYVVTVDCSVEPPETTTTTVATTTPTTTPTTGELEPEGGGVIIETTTSTTAPEPAGPSVVDTTVPGATPTTNPAPPPAGPTLPVTGSTAGIFVFSGLWLVGAGVLLHQRAAMFRTSR